MAGELCGRSPHLREPGLAHLADDVDDQLVEAGVVGVERAARETGTLRDALDGRAAGAAFGDDLACGIQQTCPGRRTSRRHGRVVAHSCLLYTSDAADDLTRVDLGGRRIIKKKK